ncbi:Hsp33 family molecular chaperone HslO [Haliangium sp.]|uniref:Hsp33 family molecular chaperone HslO n=1 Tax=Haliangium sp. TaxID=2663208 RepID=UPI003D103C15
MTDTIVRCLLPDPAVRVLAVVSTEVAREAARRHRAAAGVQVALGRGASCGLLLATLTKSGEQVTLQILGNGDLGSLMVDATDDGDVRVGLRHPEVLVPGPAGRRVSLAAGIGSWGVVSVARDLGGRLQSTGQSPLVSGEIDEDVEHYLCSSEQVDSALGCEVLLGDSEVARSAGVLVQCLPGSDAAGLVEEARARLRGGALAELLASEVDAETVARAAMGEVGPGLEVLDQRPVRFRCPCSRDRVYSALVMLGADELEQMIYEDGGAEVVCEFCRAEYQVDVEVLVEMYAESAGRAQC